MAAGPRAVAKLEALRSLLEECELGERIQGWGSGVTAHYNVATLGEQLDRLAIGRDVAAPEAEALGERIAQLARVLEPIRIGVGDGSGGEGGGGDDGAFDELGAVARWRRRAAVARRTAPTAGAAGAGAGGTAVSADPGSGTGRGAAGGGSHPPSPPPPPGVLASAASENDEIPDAMLEEVSGLAGSLRARAESIDAAVRRRSRLLDATETDLDASLAGVKSAGASAAALRRRQRWNLIGSISAILSLVIVVFATYAFIKATYFIGYRAPAKPVSWAVPQPVLAARAGAVDRLPPLGSLPSNAAAASGGAAGRPLRSGPPRDEL